MLRAFYFAPSMMSDSPGRVACSLGVRGSVHCRLRRRPTCACASEGCSHIEAGAGHRPNSTRPRAWPQAQDSCALGMPEAGERPVAAPPQAALVGMARTHGAGLLDWEAAETRTLPLRRGFCTCASDEQPRLSPGPGTGRTLQTCAASPCWKRSLHLLNFQN